MRVSDRGGVSSRGRQLGGRAGTSKQQRLGVQRQPWQTADLAGNERVGKGQSGSNTGGQGRRDVHDGRRKSGTHTYL